MLGGEDARSVQRVEGEGLTLRLTYAKGNVSSSTTSVSGGQAANSSSSQVISSSSSLRTAIISSDSGSCSEADGDARGRDDDAQSRAERIKERVFEEVGLEN